MNPGIRLGSREHSTLRTCWIRQSLDVVDAAVGQDDVALGHLLRSLLLSRAIGFALIFEFNARGNPQV